MSTPESELGWPIHRIKFGLGINDLTAQSEPDERHEECSGTMGGIMATVITITKEFTSWRSHHYAAQTGCPRERVAHAPIEVSHL